MGSYSKDRIILDVSMHKEAGMGMGERNQEVFPNLESLVGEPKILAMSFRLNFSERDNARITWVSTDSDLCAVEYAFKYARRKSQQPQSPLERMANSNDYPRCMIVANSHD